MVNADRVETFLNDRYQKGFQKLQEKRIKESELGIHPSGLMSCYRKHYWIATGEPASNPLTFLDSGSLTLGTLIHKFFENILKEESPNDFIEKKVKFGDIKGTTDYVPCIDGNYIILDHKTTSDKSYYKYKEEDLPERTQAQLVFYAMAMKETYGIDIKQCAVEYINQNMYDMTQRFVKVFDITEKHKNTVKEYIKKLRGYIEKQELPEGIPILKDNLFWECGYTRLKWKGGYLKWINSCEYFDKCRALKGNAEKTYWQCKARIDKSIENYNSSKTKKEE